MTPDTVMVDKKVTYGNWSPQNSDKTFSGSMTLSHALALSVNTIAVQLAEKVGPEKIIENAEKMGITTLVTKGSPNDINYAMALGGLTKGVTPLEMASAYGTFANKGVHVKPTAIIKILDRNGNVLEDDSTSKKENKTQAISEKVAYEITAMLEGVIDHGTGTAAAIGRPAAGKTGTTDDNKDAWFIGYTPDIVTAVWIGDDTGNHTLGDVYGGTIPAQIWHDYMVVAAEDEKTRDFYVPAGMSKIQPQEDSKEEKPEKKTDGIKKAADADKQKAKNDAQKAQQPALNNKNNKQ
jgi:penicillin-binding protein 1A